MLDVDPQVCALVRRLVCVDWIDRMTSSEKFLRLSVEGMGVEKTIESHPHHVGDLKQQSSRGKGTDFKRVE